MAAHELIVGPNFSGRSALLMRRLRERTPGASFYIGPYAEAALSGLSSTVADEIEIYGTNTAQDRSGFQLLDRIARDRPTFDVLDLKSFADRKPPTLSGGEQVLLALHCFSISTFRAIGIDTALEQLDPDNRALALLYLTFCEDQDALLIDNRLDHLDDWSRIDASEVDHRFACDLAAAVAPIAPRAAPAIAIEGLSFHYPGGWDVFADTSFMLAPGKAHRLTGANGTGKTTLMKLLAGVLRPSAGAITLDGAPYEPWTSGNRLFALATQNPDHQWCGATLAEDLTRRCAALAHHKELQAPTSEQLSTLATLFGIASRDQHLYELPLAARKRLSWLWPLTGTMPWIMLDEPTVGQDRATCEALARAIDTMCARGYGVIFITHDDDFADMIAHEQLLIAQGTISS